MTKYLNTKPGSVEEVVANMNKDLRQDGAYQDMFKKELDKAGKGIGSMSPKEKKDFFNKIDSKYKAKNEQVVPKGSHKMPDGTIMKDKDHKKEGGPGSGPQGGETRGTYKTGHKKSVMKPGAGARPGSAPDGGQTDKEADDYDTEINAELGKEDDSIVKKVVSQLKKATKAHSGQAKDLEKAMKTEADQHGDEINQKKTDKVKADKKVADSGSKATKVETEPKVDYKN